MRHAFQFKINFKGGIVSPGYLYNLLEGLQKAGLRDVRFGLRQQLLIDAAKKDHGKIVIALDAIGADYEINQDVYPNISSSYPAAEIFIRDTWLSEGVYKDIFDLFEHKPKLKINIADAQQTFMPFFTGNINWISSKHSHFWYLYIRFPKTNILYEWKELIYTNDIARLSDEIEKVIFKEADAYYDNIAADGNKLYAKLTTQNKFISKPVTEKLELPSFKLPYYEGYNNYGTKSWLGIYRRDELFSISFLKDVCRVCLETKSGELYTTPWKSLIIKSIEDKNRPHWTSVLNKHRINVRHAYNELNWQVEDVNEDGLIIKRQIIREFEQHDVRTYGLCFAIKTQPKSGLYGSVLVKRQFNLIRGKLKPVAKFDILYTADFNPNSKEFIVFRNDVARKHLPAYLIGLCKYFYEQEHAGDLLPGSSYIDETIPEQKNDAEKYIYQCIHCKTVYDEEVGEPENDIEAGTLFNNLNFDYCCPLCEAPKNDFEQKQQKLLGLITA
jgi:rubredoxin